MYEYITLGDQPFIFRCRPNDKCTQSSVSTEISGILGLDRTGYSSRIPYFFIKPVLCHGQKHEYCGTFHMSYNLECLWI